VEDRKEIIDHLVRRMVDEGVFIQAETPPKGKYPLDKWFCAKCREWHSIDKVCSLAMLDASYDTPEEWWNEVLPGILKDQDFKNWMVRKLMGIVNIEIDREAKAVYIKFKDGEVYRSIELGFGTVIDVDKDGKIINLEVLLPPYIEIEEVEKR